MYYYNEVTKEYVGEIEPIGDGFIGVNISPLNLLGKLQEEESIIFDEKNKKWFILEKQEDIGETIRTLEYELQGLESQKNEAIAEMQKNFLLGKEDKARSSAQEMDDLDNRIDELREKITDLKEKLDK